MTEPPLSTALSAATALSAWARPVAPDVIGMRVLIANLYFVGEPKPDGAWTLVDAGLFDCAARIQAAAEELYGPGTRPQAIVLTHAHFDHIGAVSQLAKQWNVPVYAHALELLYLNGGALYPPADPDVGGGAMALLSPLYPRAGAVETRVQPLPADGSVPSLPGWQAIHTPGHSPGHVSLFRASDRVLLAGDAFVTTQQESALAVLAQKAEVRRPPAYFTINWQQARASVETLASLNPSAVGTGHGPPMSGTQLHDELQTLARRFDEIALPQGRFYATHPARYDEHGLVRSEQAPDQKAQLLLKLLAFFAILLMLRSLRHKPQD